MNEDADRAVRTARNESLFRDVNERVKELNEGFTALAQNPEWICECANPECFEPIRMTQEEYEAVRARGSDCFFVKPGEAHVAPERENVVERHERYWVVQKFGLAAEVAEEEATSTD